jgi:hypothetical protein
MQQGSESSHTLNDALNAAGAKIQLAYLQD